MFRRLPILIGFALMVYTITYHSAPRRMNYASDVFFSIEQSPMAEVPEGIISWLGGIL